MVFYSVAQFSPQSDYSWWIVSYVYPMGIGVAVGIVAGIRASYLRATTFILLLCFIFFQDIVLRITVVPECGFGSIHQAIGTNQQGSNCIGDAIGAGLWPLYQSALAIVSSGLCILVSGVIERHQKNSNKWARSISIKTKMNEYLLSNGERDFWD